MRCQLALTALLLLSACALGSEPVGLQASAVSQSGVSPSRITIFPLIAHHQHLMSPTNLADQSGEPPLPIASLPAELDRLLQERGAVSGSSAPNDLFTDDAQVLRISQGDWVRGRPAIREFLGFVAKGLRYRPNAYGLSGSSGFIAGTVQLGDAGSDVLNFVMALKKGVDGKWRIAAESATIKPPPDYTAPITADSLIAQMDDAGIDRGVVLSIAYAWASVFRKTPVADEYGKVRAENDWTVEQVAKYPDRLVAFCGVNPLRDYAIQELRRCARIPHVKGMKLHFANSGIDVRKPEHVEKVRQFFRAANENRLAIVAHVMVPGEYGSDHSRIFLNQILPEAPDVTVQIAHLAGSGPGYGPDEALAVFADAFEAGNPVVENLYVDVAGIVTDNQSEEVSTLMVRRMRQIGLQRILYGSDMQPNPPPAAAWATFRRTLPLTDDELRTIASNVAPYMR